MRKASFSLKDAVHERLDFARVHLREILSIAKRLHDLGVAGVLLARVLIQTRGIGGLNRIQEFLLGLRDEPAIVVELARELVLVGFDNPVERLLYVIHRWGRKCLDRLSLLEVLGRHELAVLGAGDAKGLAFLCRVPHRRADCILHGWAILEHARQLGRPHVRDFLIEFAIRFIGVGAEIVEKLLLRFYCVIAAKNAIHIGAHPLAHTFLLRLQLLR